MKTLQVFVLLALCALPIFGQQASTEPYDWSGMEKKKSKPKPAQENKSKSGLQPIAAPSSAPKKPYKPGITRAFATGTIAWQPEGKDFDRYYTRGILHKSVIVEGVMLWAAIIPRRVGGKDIRVDKFIATVGVDNQGELRFDFMPEEITLEVLGEKPKFLPRETASQIQKSLNRKAFWQSFALVATSAMMTSTSYATLRTPYGSTSLSVTTPDYAAQQRALWMSDEFYRQASAGAISLDDAELKAETLRPDGFVRGFVYFKNDKSAKDVLLTIKLNGKTVQIPFAIERGK